MLSNLKWFIGAGLAALLFAGGYSFGARKVDSLEAQIRDIKLAADDAEAKRKKNEEEIARLLKDKEAEYARQSQQLKAEADKRAKDLTIALAGANSRIASLQGQVRDVEARRAMLITERDAASADERKKYQDQIDALERDRKELLAKVDANECLALQVPDQVIESLAGKK
jgi:peptidoglycan hydrolase CwlO-like protein